MNALLIVTMGVEVEFVIQRDSQLILIEVKPAVNTRAKSLRCYTENGKPGLVSRFSTN